MKVNWGEIRKTGVVLLGMALTAGFGLGLHGAAQQILVVVAAIATAFGVWRVPNDLPPKPSVTVSGGGHADVGPLGSGA